jgi:hypothetical protein
MCTRIRISLFLSRIRWYSLLWLWAATGASVLHAIYCFDTPVSALVAKHGHLYLLTDTVDIVEFIYCLCSISISICTTEIGVDDA